MGTRTATGNIVMGMTGEIANLLDADETGTPTASLGDRINATYTTGVAANQIDRIWSDKGRTLSGATSENIDVFDFGTIDIGAGAGLDALGQALALAEIVAILIENQSGSTGTLTVGAEGSAAEWESLLGDGSTIILKPGEVFFARATADPAWAVADTTNHLLKLASSANLTYNIHIFGRSS